MSRGIRIAALLIVLCIATTAHAQGGEVRFRGAAVGQQWAVANMERIAATIDRRLREEGFIK